MILAETSEYKGLEASQGMRAGSYHANRGVAPQGCKVCAPPVRKDYTPHLNQSDVVCVMMRRDFTHVRILAWFYRHVGSVVDILSSWQCNKRRSSGNV